VLLQGYGVELVLKRTDYVAVDDSNKPTENAAAEQAPTPADTDAGEFEMTTAPRVEPLKPAELTGTTGPPVGILRRLSCDLAVSVIAQQAAQYALAAADPLRALRHVLHNFPSGAPCPLVLALQRTDAARRSGTCAGATAA
jgi:hypothetical protein